eukprot:TRINITY_DN2309_c0_g1_i2.p1 TRINITY_DN2309_c0_g1~~TRINITY_DN2309_c0_g1_i2.p1  ORF type:complete len:534 (-),score=166.93 TRINITY_DN2309_c0_g1_i2:22-1623(-)
MAGFVNWCKRYTTGYPGVDVKDITWSFADGLAFCALMHNFRPDLIGDFRRLKAVTREDKIYNLNLAFNAAEKVGIPKLLDAEDLVDFGQPDRKCLTTYISNFPKKFGEADAKHLGGIMTRDEHETLKKQKEQEFMDDFKRSQQGGQLQAIFNKKKLSGTSSFSAPSSPIISKSSSEESKVVSPPPGKLNAQLPKSEEKSSAPKPAESLSPRPAPGKLKISTLNAKSEEKTSPKPADNPSPGRLANNVFQQQQEEKRKKLEAERLKKEEDDKKQREEAERLKKEEEEKLKREKEEAERLKKAEEEKLKKEKEEAERLKKEEEEKKRREEAERLKKEEEEKLKKEKEEADRLKQEEEEKLKKEKEEAREKELLKEDNLSPRSAQPEAPGAKRPVGAKKGALAGKVGTMKRPLPKVGVAAPLGSEAPASPVAEVSEKVSDAPPPLNSPKLAGGNLKASPKLATKLSSPKLASPKANLPKANPKANTPKTNSPKTAELSPRNEISPRSEAIQLSPFKQAELERKKKLMELSKNTTNQ